MRLVQVAVPTGKREAVTSVLDEEGIDYVLSEETSGRQFDAVITFPVPRAAVEPILDDLRTAGIERDAYTVVVNAETVVSKDFEALAERYAEEGDEERIAREELESAAQSLAPTRRTFVIMTVVSTLIATAGLLLDSPAVVVGSMVIAPLVGPAMAASVGTVVDDQDLFERGVKLQVGGLLLAVLAAAAFAGGLRAGGILPPGLDPSTIPSVRERVAPDVLSLVVALGAGVAGAVSLTTGVSTAIVGVMIAVALLPPAATVGIGLAWGAPMVALGAGVLALVNTMSVNLAALAVLWSSGYRPDRWFRFDEARVATLKRVGALAVAIVVLSSFLVAVTVAETEQARFEDRVDRAVAGTVHDEYPGLVLVESRVIYSDEPVFSAPRRIVVTVGRPTDQPYPELAREIRGAVAERTGRTVSVQVRFVDVQTAGGVQRPGRPRGIGDYLADLFPWWEPTLAGR